MSYKNTVTVEAIDKKLDQIMAEEQDVKRILEGLKDA